MHPPAGLRLPVPFARVALIGAVTGCAGPPGDTGPADTGTPWNPVPYSDDGAGTLFVNEFQASNQATLVQPDGGTPDWIELFDPGAADLDLEGFFATDDLAVPDRYAIPAGVTVPAGGFLLLYADGSPELGPDHLPFKLSASGEQIGLYEPDGTVVNEIVFGVQPADRSAARVPDGGPDWAFDLTPTPGATNGEAGR